jgi:L-aspartate oxidase
MRERRHFDGVVVVGAGLAGLTAALAAAPRRALVLSPWPLGEGAASAWAQGGIAAALAQDDSPAQHAVDTVAAGAGLCDAQAVAVLTREGPDAVRALAALGAPFDRNADGGFVQSLEAAHGRPRVARVGGDGAGRAIMAAVIEAAQRAPHIEFGQGARARALILDDGGRVRGVLAQTGQGWVEIIASATVLATGGLGGLYAVTTNPASTLGEGLALAAAAGAVIRDPEFVQFHPTALDIGLDPAPLATEALRGEGARLINGVGEAFMGRYDPAADLAPRDVVARAIQTEIARTGRVFLDARAAVGAAFDREFPAVFAAAMSGGVDPRTQAMPIAPAAHYHMGGVATDLRGATSLEGLFAAGECAAVGVHGANRLASNSLLEAAVFGRRAGEAARDLALPRGSISSAHPLPDLPEPDLTQLRRRMAADAGVVRDGAGLSALSDFIADQRERRGLAPPLIAAGLVVEGALARRESRGAHRRSDYPDRADQAASTRLTLSSRPAARVRAA